MEKNWNIVIVEDEYVYYNLLKMMLRKYPYNIVHFTEYKQLEEFLKDYNDKTIVVIDYHLRTHTGANYIESLKSVGIDTKFIAITSSENPDIEKEMRSLGALAFFLKDQDFIKNFPEVLDGIITLELDT